MLCQVTLRIRNIITIIIIIIIIQYSSYLNRWICLLISYSKQLLTICTIIIFWSLPGLLKSHWKQLILFQQSFVRGQGDQTGSQPGAAAGLNVFPIRVLVCLSNPRHIHGWLRHTTSVRNIIYIFAIFYHQGGVAETYGKKSVLLSCLIASGLGYLLLGWVQALWVISLLRVYLGRIHRYSIFLFYILWLTVKSCVPLRQLKVFCEMKVLYCQSSVRILSNHFSCSYLPVYMYMWKYILMYVYACVSTCIYVYVCVCVCMYVLYHRYLWNKLVYLQGNSDGCSMIDVFQ